MQKYRYHVGAPRLLCDLGSPLTLPLKWGGDQSGIRMTLVLVVVG